MPGNTRGNFAMAPCGIFLRGTLGRNASVFFTNWGLGFGFVDALSDLEVAFLTTLNLDLELLGDEDVDDAVEKKEGKMKAM